MTEEAKSLCDSAEQAAGGAWAKASGLAGALRKLVAWVMSVEKRMEGK